MYAIAGKDEPVKIRLNHNHQLEERESYKLEIAPDNMQAVVRFYPPSKNGEKMTRNEFISDLGFKGIKFGIQEKVIDKFFHSRRYCENIVVAVGQPPRHGTDAYIEYYFNTDLKRVRVKGRWKRGFLPFEYN